MNNFIKVGTIIYFSLKTKSNIEHIVLKKCGKPIKGITDGNPRMALNRDS